MDAQQLRQITDNPRDYSTDDLFAACDEIAAQWEKDLERAQALSEELLATIDSFSEDCHKYPWEL